MHRLAWIVFVALITLLAIPNAGIAQESDTSPSSGDVSPTDKTAESLSGAVDEGAYLQVVNEVSQRMGDIESQAGVIMQRYKSSQTDSRTTVNLLTPLMNGSGGLGAMQYRLIQLQPPPRFAHFHDLMLQTYTEYGLAIQDFEIALAYKDPSFLNSEAKHMDTSLRLGNEAADELQMLLN
jgi:hypothetical protein